MEPPKSRFYEPDIYKVVILLSAITVWSGMLFGLMWPSLINISLIIAVVLFNIIAYKRRESAIYYLAAAMTRGILITSIPISAQFTLSLHTTTGNSWAALSLCGFIFAFAVDILFLKHKWNMIAILSEESGKTQLASNIFYIDRPFPQLRRSVSVRLFPLVWIIPSLALLLAQGLDDDIKLAGAHIAFAIVSAGLAPLSSRPFLWIMALRRHEKRNGVVVLTEYGRRKSVQ